MKFFLVASILLLLVLLFAYICYRITFHSPHKHQNDIYNIPPAEQYQAQKEMTMEMIRSFDALPFERVFITSRDGLKLSGRYYHRRDGAPLGIGFHGYRGTAIRDFCGGGTISLDAGHNLLLIDQRSQNLSEGHTITFGVKERFDCLDWVQYAVDRFGPDVQILLYGISMGASTVLMVSGLNPPPNVRGIVADSPYTTPAEIIKKVCRDMKLPPALVYPFIVLGGLLFGRVRFGDASAVEAVKRSPIPILLIHGEDDRYVPCDMGRAIAAANPEKIDLQTFPNAGHGISYTTDTSRYRELAAGFIRRCFDTDEP